jgi:hypothetical protein
MSLIVFRQWAAVSKTFRSLSLDLAELVVRPGMERMITMPINISNATDLV